MPTKFNLNIDSRTSDDMSGDGVTQNTNIRSDDPNELIAVLQKLAGLASPVHDGHEVGPTGAVVVKHAAPMASSPCGAMMEEESKNLDDESDDEEDIIAVSPFNKNRTGNYSRWARGYDDAQRDVQPDPRYAHNSTYMRGFKKGLDDSELDVKTVNPYEEPNVSTKRRGDSMSASGRERDYEGDPQPLSGEFDFSESEINEALANAPRPKTMKNLLDIVNTDHTAKAPTQPVPAKSGDNPLTDSDEEHLMEARLMRDWQETKIQNYVESFDIKSANIALSKGRDSFVIGTKEYAIRENDGHRIVYPVIDNRVMTQVPVYITEAGIAPDWNDPDTKKFYDKPAAQRMASGETEPVDTTDYETPPAMRKDAKRAKELERLYGRKFGHDSLEEEKDIKELSLFRLWNLHANSLVMSRDPYVSTQISDDAKRVKSEIEAHVRNEYSPAVLHDMIQYSRHMMSYEMNPERNEEELERATSIARRYSFSSDSNHEEPADMMQKDHEADANLSTDAELIHSEPHTKKVSEAKKKNKYAIGMAAAMTATGDKPPLKKSTITKAHEIADKIKEGSKKK